MIATKPDPYLGGAGPFFRLNWSLTGVTGAGRGDRPPAVDDEVPAVAETVIETPLVLMLMTELLPSLVMEAVSIESSCDLTQRITFEVGWLF